MKELIEIAKDISLKIDVIVFMLSCMVGIICPCLIIITNILRKGKEK